MRKCFLAGRRGVKKRVFEKKRAFFVFCLFIERKEKRWKMEKDNFKKKENRVCGWLWTNKVLLLKMTFLEKLANTTCVRKVKKLSVLGKCHFLCDHATSPNTTKIGVSACTGHFLVARAPFWEGARIGALLSVIHKSCALHWKHYF